jgi:hypothetical protein
MTQAQRKRLLVRVLCELVAYGEEDEAEPEGPALRIPAYTREPTPKPSTLALTPF